MEKKKKKHCCYSTANGFILLLHVLSSSVIFVPFVAYLTHHFILLSFNQVLYSYNPI